MQPTVLDLFAGCGGFSVGLDGAGLCTIGAVEFDKWAADSIRLNFPKAAVVEEDIRNISRETASQFEGVDVIVGGPPCQGFSVAGPTQYGLRDHRNTLADVLLDWVEWLYPKVVVIENVPGVLRKGSLEDGKSVEDLVRSRLEPLGFSVSAQILVAADYGVPQLRRRAFIVASRTKSPYLAPAATHAGTGQMGDLFRAKGYVSVGEAIGDLPQLEAGQGVEEVVPYPTPALNPYQISMRAGSPGVANHIAMRHTARLIERFKTIQPGKSLKDVAPEFGQLRKLTGEVAGLPFKYNNFRLPADAPSLSIPASFQSLFLHPTLHRNLTAREAARLMSFPDTFVFQGKRTTMSWEKHLSQYNQIGNAVCPLVGAAVGGSIRQALDSGVTNRRQAPSSTRLTSTPASRPPVSEAQGWSSPRLLDAQVVRLLAQVGQRLLATNPVAEDTVAAAVALATLLATEEDCLVCRKDLEPRGRHLGQLPLLITKEDTDSLVSTENDHGLDFHLRVLLGTDFRVTHQVAEALSRTRLAVLGMARNVRTGRNVRALMFEGIDQSVERLRPQIRQLLSERFTVSEGAIR